MRVAPLVLGGLFLLLIMSNVHGITITGTAYDGLTFEPLKNAVITINTIPNQVKLSKDGTYAFEVPPGMYELKASFTEQGVVLLESVQEIEVLDTSGVFVSDIILLPELDSIPDTSIPDEPTFLEQLFEGPLIWLVLIGIVLVAAGYSVMRVQTTIPETHKQKTDGHGSHEEKKKKLIPVEKELDTYAWEIIHIIQRGGNRVTQKDLRAKMNIGEAKVSLVVSELENYAILKKIKRGRGNILILTEKGREMASKNKQTSDATPSPTSPDA